MDGMVKMDLSFFSGKKVFITGHTGFKGSWMSRILMDSGASLTGYALPPDTQPNIFTIAKIADNMKSIMGDVRDLKKLSKAVKEASPDIVIHMAAQPLVRESYKNPVYTYETNVLGTVNILEACRYAGSIRSIVNVTTDKVYENKELARGYREDEKLCGHDPYSNSKSCSEIVTHGYKYSFYNTADSPAVSTARSGNVIGGGDFSADRIIPDCVRAALTDKNVIIRNPKSVRPYQHVIDCISGYLLLAEKQYDKSISESYNFGPDENDIVENEVLADIFCAVWGQGMKSEHKNDGGPREANFLRLDTSKAKTVLGWKSSINIKKAVELTVEWHKQYNSKNNAVKCMDGQINSYFGKD